MTVRDIFKIILDRIVLIVAIPFIFGSIMAVYVFHFVEPTYTVNTTLYVITRQNKSQITYSDYTLSELLMNDYKELGTSDRVYSAVAERMDVPPEVLRKMCSVKITSVSKSRVMNVSVRSKDPVFATNFANIMSTEFSSSLKRVMDADGVNVIDYATLPKTPSAPAKLQLTIIAAGVGLVLSVCIVLAMEFLNTTIRTAEDVETELKLPVLAKIPLLEEKANEQHNR